MVIGKIYGKEEPWLFLKSFGCTVQSRNRWAELGKPQGNCDDPKQNCEYELRSPVLQSSGRHQKSICGCWWQRWQENQIFIKKLAVHIHKNTGAWGLLPDLPPKCWNTTEHTANVCKLRETLEVIWLERNIPCDIFLNMDDLAKIKCTLSQLRECGGFFNDVGNRSNIGGSNDKPWNLGFTYCCSIVKNKWIDCSHRIHNWN